MSGIIHVYLGFSEEELQQGHGYFLTGGCQAICMATIQELNRIVGRRYAVAVAESMPDHNQVVNSLRRQRIPAVIVKVIGVDTPGRLNTAVRMVSGEGRNVGWGQ